MVRSRAMRGRLTEETFLGVVRRHFGDLAPPSPAGIGDDAAVVGPPRSGRLLAATDGLIESVHFRRGEPPYLLGRKSLAVNLSDVAAMGGRPTGFLLTLAVPKEIGLAWLEPFLAGLASSAREHRTPLLGGDTCGSCGPIVISIAILGDMGRGRKPALTRDGARPGDGLYVSGPLGGSATGRRLLEAGWRPVTGRGGREVRSARPPGRATQTERTRAAEALRAHLDPAARLALGAALRERGIPSAAMDLSDGLGLDLWRLAKASRVGARVIEPAVPIADSARALAARVKAKPLDLALHGGEDYELLFCVPPSREPLVHGLKALCIGRITSASRGVVLAGAKGRVRPLPPSGFDHFQSGSLSRR